ncbi:MAG TPA: glycosyltransferase family 2 protein [Terrimesophilobacter sp.]|nr:glycosyltransferase family 2 protein [Terrimesophilobacter sp.]
MATSSGSTTHPAYGIATVSYGSEEVLGPFLASVRRASAAPLAIAIADNLPTEDSAVTRLAVASNAIYVPLPVNVGYGAAMNAAVAALPESVTWVLLSNPDVVLSDGAVDRLVDAAQADSHIGSIGPALLNSDGTLYPSAREVPSLRTGVGHAMFSNLWPTNPWSRRYRKDSEIPTEQRDAGWLSGACLLVRRDVFTGLGGFDPRFFMYFEDVDLGFRLGKDGYRNVYEPSVKVTHTGAHSTTTESVTMIAAHHTSAKLFLAKKYAGPLLWPVRATLTAGLAIRSALVTRRVRKQGN